MEIPTDIEDYRDLKWRREDSLRIETPSQVEAMVEDLGFCLTLTDSRTPLPSVYIAVCGRRDAFTPKNVQKDPETSLAWVLKDEVMRRGKVYYGKVVKGRAMFIAPRLIPAFNAIWGIPRSHEKERLSENALKILKVLRKEWEMGTSDLRAETKIAERSQLTKALEELQKRMKVVPLEVLYKPKFTYVWTLAEARFPNETAKKLSRPAADIEIARAYLAMQGQTARGALASAFGFYRPVAGLANHALVDEGYAERIGTGIYRLSSLAK